MNESRGGENKLVWKRLEILFFFMVQKSLKTKWNAAIDDRTQGMEHATALFQTTH